MIIGCLICGCIFKMWENFHNAATRVSYCISPSPHLRTMSADCPGIDRIQCFVSSPTWPVQSTKPCHIVELQLEYMWVVHFNEKKRTAKICETFVDATLVQRWT